MVCWQSELKEGIESLSHPGSIEAIRSFDIRCRTVTGLLPHSLRGDFLHFGAKRRLFDIFQSNAEPTYMQTAVRGMRLLESQSMSHKPSLPQPLALRPREAAKALGISERTLWTLTHEGSIPCVRLGTGKRRAVLYPIADLQAWLTRQSSAAIGGAA